MRRKNMYKKCRPIEIDEPVTYYGKVIGRFKTTIIPYIKEDSLEEE